MARAPFQVLVLPYRTTGPRLEVAIFHRADYALWQFVSGGGEEAETANAAAIRELDEEAGFRAANLMPLQAMTMIPGCWFRSWASWPSDTLVVPEHAFAADVGDATLTLSTEHTELAWVGMDEAMARLRYDSNKNALWELNERLFPRKRGKRPAYQ